MWLGVDDTDRPDGGCTTWVLTDLVRLARRHGLALTAWPRLVRLNPNIPWKTRGNAALAARFGLGRGPARWAGEIDGERVAVHLRGEEPDAATARRFREAAWQLVDGRSPAAPGTDPALVATTLPPDPELYWKAVREVVEPSSTEAALRRLRAWWRARGDGRGVVGAAAAIAWPARRATWELIAYRRDDRVGTPREVDAASVIAAQEAEPSLFLCHDPRTRRLLVAPHTNCPILYGLRASDRAAAVRAARTVRSEPVDRKMLFRTNQGTGDHLVRATAATWLPYGSAIVRGSVADRPRALRGGHVAFVLTDRTGGEIRCVAFEPTKTLPVVAQKLLFGDEVEVWGGRDREAVLRLEGLRLLRLASRDRRTAPRCTACDRRAGSLGKGRGYRCPGCRSTFPPEAGVRQRLARDLALGAVHPTPSARRHLAPRAPEP